MNQVFSPEALEELIYQVRTAKPGRDTLYCTVGAWKSELLKHPERFRVDSDGLSYLGYLVGLIGNERETEEFQCLVDKILKENNK